MRVGLTNQNTRRKEATVQEKTSRGELQRADICILTLRLQPTEIREMKLKRDQDFPTDCYHDIGFELVDLLR